MQIKAFSVTQLNSYIKRILTADPILYNIRVKGEISNFKHHSSGHMYFTLKDQDSRISCVMFKGNCEKLKFKIKEGMNVIIGGYISIYERDGQYQLYANSMEPSGMGELYLAFQQLKEKLEKEGFFDIKHKKPIPYIPAKIGIVTSPTGAAIRDMLNIIDRRFPKVNILIYPVQVQGDMAAWEIAKAINLANLDEEIDVLIIGRGGGSIEELWAFNEEVVANSIYHSRIPIISAVGHETDYTISDFVADLRAPTPSAAAELVVPDVKELLVNLENKKRRLLLSTKSRIYGLRERLKAIKNSYPFKYPQHHISQERQRLDRCHEKLIKLIKNDLKYREDILLKYGDRLNGLSPLSILSRGYSITTTEEGEMLTSICQVRKTDKLLVKLKDGTLGCIVTDVKEDKNEKA